MSHIFDLPHGTPPCNLCELFLWDVASLLASSRFIRRTLPAIRPDCAIPDELVAYLDLIVAISKAGESRLQAPLVEAGAVLPATVDHTTPTLVAALRAGAPVAVLPGVRAAELAANLRLLVQHLELKVRLAAEAALLVGQSRLSLALVDWANKWRDCGRTLRAVTIRARARAYVADLEENAAGFC
jgi:hypothetical protein